MRAARALGCALALAVLASGCGDDRPQGVTITEAEDPRPTAQPRPSLAFDTVYADSGLFADSRLRPDSLRADSLRRDSLRTDSLRQDSLRRAALGPDFRTFWPVFRADVAEGDRAGVRSRTGFSDRLGEDAFEWLYDAAFVAEPFRTRIADLTARDFERDGTAREVTIIVGYDAEGTVVPQDEAETESSVTLRFEVVDGDYWLVEVSPAG